MKMEFVDEQEVDTEEEMAEDERGRIVLIGEPLAVCADGEAENASCFSAVIGAEYTAAVGLARLGHSVLYCTRLGKDSAGQHILKELESNGVSTDLVTVTDGAHTGAVSQSMLENGEVYACKGSAASAVSVQAMSRLDLYGCDFLHITGVFPSISKLAFEAVRRLIARAKALDIFVSFAPTLCPSLWSSEREMVRSLNTLAQEVDLILPSIGAGKILTGRDTAEEIAAYYHGMGVDSVVVRLEEGAYWSTGGESGIVSAFPAEETGDAAGVDEGFAAGILSAVEEGLSLQEAAYRGTILAALQTAHRGGTEGLPTREKLDTVLEAGAV